MSRIHDVLRWANRTAVAEEVTRRGYRVSQETLNRWVRQEKEVPAIVERIVFELFTIDGHSESSPPAWAEGLLTKADMVAVLDALARSGATSPLASQVAETGLAALGEPPSGAPAPGTQAMRPATRASS